MKITGCIDLWKRIASFHVSFLDVELICLLTRDVFRTKKTPMIELFCENSGFQALIIFVKKFHDFISSTGF